jgi:alpha-1,3-rhamnosyltransferase
MFSVFFVKKESLVGDELSLDKVQFPLVSVIVPLYNHAKYIEKTISSVLAQDYINIELLVIDDGSTDCSKKIVEELNDTFNFRFISRENKGLANTLNEGVNSVNGKYVAIVASDDYWEGGKISKQVAFLENNEDIGVCHTFALEVDDEGNDAGKIYQSSFQGDIFEKLLICNEIVASSAMYRKELFKNDFLFDPSFQMEDYDMWFRLSRITKFGIVTSPCTYLRKHNSNLSGNIKLMIQNEHALFKKNLSRDELKASFKTQPARRFRILSGTEKLLSLHYLKEGGIIKNLKQKNFYVGFIKLFLIWRK